VLDYNPWGVEGKRVLTHRDWAPEVDNSAGLNSLYQYKRCVENIRGINTRE
jgi:hypothetical protein